MHAGKQGAVIGKIRDQFNVNIQLPRKGDEEQDVIIITGYEADANAAKEEILGIVHELVNCLFKVVCMRYIQQHILNGIVIVGGTRKVSRRGGNRSSGPLTNHWSKGKNRATNHERFQRKRSQNECSFELYKYKLKFWI